MAETWTKEALLDDLRHVSPSSMDACEVVDLCETAAFHIEQVHHQLRRTIEAKRAAEQSRLRIGQALGLVWTAKASDEEIERAILAAIERLTNGK